MHDPDPRAGIAAAIGRVAIQSDTVFRFDGEPTSVGTAPGNWAGVRTADPLVGAIQMKIYERCYAQRPPDTTSAAAVDPGFARRLVAANPGRERWERGWMVTQIAPNGQVFVRKGDRERTATPGTFIFDAVAAGGLRIGSSVGLFVPHESFDAQPGYYFAFGDTLDELAESLSLVRLYFHCTPDGAVALLQHLSVALNRFQVPFQFKTPTSPSLYGRTDAAVLYVAMRFFGIAARVVERLLDRVGREPAVPLFTKPLWPGVAAAVDPGSGESFGVHRSRLVAEALVAAARSGGAQDEATRMAAVAARFASVGLDMARPWLSPGGFDPFERPAPVRLP